MKALLLLICIVISTPVIAEEEWSFLWAVRSYDWFVRDATAQLDRSGNILVGEARDSQGTVFRINIELSEDKATGTVTVVPGDAGSSFLVGTYSRVISPGPSNCWETIQLFDGHNYVGLARNTSCEP